MNNLTFTTRFKDALYAARNPADFREAPDPSITIPFADVSRWQPTIDYAAMVAGGWDVLLVKSSEAYFTDPLFETHWRGFHAAGGLVLCYHFFRSNLPGKPQAEAALDFTADLIAAQGKTLIVADVETSDSVSNSTRATRLLDFLTTIDGAGQAAGVYSSPSLWQSLFQPNYPGWINNYWQWVAHWTPALLPSLPFGWSWDKTLFWQQGIAPTHSWVPRPPGYPSGSIDVNAAFVADRADLEARLGISGAPPAPPTSGIVLEPLGLVQVLSAGGLNLRAEPSVTSTIKTAFPFGTVLEAAKIEQFALGEEWCLVYEPVSGQYGWAAALYGGKVYLTTYEE